ncbi:DUF1847 domain-containing protein [Neobittarella massiliensis]|uniref:DUF1847 domain-containing protein n=2 Tax=Oscillospiraceae TaxID=216572 RepID=A0A8J6INI3_9FIRM|nr:DUF1847 domain-containing protein [Neobittarella massiliensis]MBC3515965.1 DUF1847 domain-containing protein [Neobittarella massiliensis]SCJ41116.1 Uncharacterized metal-binding protein conserved in archaea [uncultured Anaerotruncus sp.]
MDHIPAHSCVDCFTTSCSAHDGKNPDFCLTTGLDPQLHQQVLALYQNDALIHRLAVASAEVEAEGYRQWPRVKETVVFARKIGAKKIGIATCVGLVREAGIFAKILRKNGFEVYGVACKVGSTPKSDIGIDEAHQMRPGESCCNPVLQAELLNRAGTDLNVVIGLCVGHDSLFYRYSKAVTTTLVVKDRVLGHNPVAALYTANSYYKDLLQEQTR